MNPKAARALAAQQQAMKMRLTLMDGVPSLDDFDMSLGELHEIIGKLMKQHGPHAKLKSDGGHNNVSFELYYEYSGEELKEFLASRGDK